LTDNQTHMRREIEEIGQATERLLKQSGAELKAAGENLRKLDPRVLITVARGSSDHAASYMKYAIELMTGVPVASIGPSIASIYGAKLKLAGSACLAVSQSGKSPDIVAMANLAKAGGALTIALTNTPGSPLAEGADHAIDIAAGPERSVAATKTFVNSAVAGLGILAHWSGDKKLQQAIDSLPGQFDKAVNCDWSDFAKAIGDRDSLFVLGRGPSMAMSNEAALKFKETSSVHAESYSAAEVMHGPLALVGPGFPVLALIARDESEESSVAVADTLAGKEAAIFATVANAGRAKSLPFAATGHPLTDPLSLIVSFYAFVEAFARSRGLNPDEPRNLRKVTETV
jgi:glucosamine--fructose-6-phosphate aminotransferase (isomerizing)